MCVRTCVRCKLHGSSYEGRVPCVRVHAGWCPWGREAWLGPLDPVMLHQAAAIAGISVPPWWCQVVRNAEELEPAVRQVALLMQGGPRVSASGGSGMTSHP